MKILVSGLLNVETTVAVKSFPIEYYPIDYPFFGINSNVSGVGFNISKALKALGDEVRLVSFLADDPEGERVINELKMNGISADSICYNLKNTPVSTVLYDKKGRRQIYCDLKDIQEQTLVSGDVDMSDCDIAALCNINFNRELIKTAKSQGILTATDVHVLSDPDDEYNRDFMENADILFMSDEKLPCDAGEFITRIYNRYRNRIIVIGMGDRGAMLFDGKSKVTIPACKNVKVVNTVGAGDALFSAFLHFYSKDNNAEQALRKAVVFAGIKIGFNGASVGFCGEDELLLHCERFSS